MAKGIQFFIEFHERLPLCTYENKILTSLGNWARLAGEAGIGPAFGEAGILLESFGLCGNQWDLGRE
jgi:hypothetical protein